MIPSQITIRSLSLSLSSSCTYTTQDGLTFQATLTSTNWVKSLQHWAPRPRSNGRCALPLCPPFQLLLLLLLRHHLLSADSIRFAGNEELAWLHCIWSLTCSTFEVISWVHFFLLHRVEPSKAPFCFVLFFELHICTGVSSRQPALTLWTFWPECWSLIPPNALLLQRYRKYNIYIFT